MSLRKKIFSVVIFSFMTWGCAGKTGEVMTDEQSRQNPATSGFHFGKGRRVKTGSKRFHASSSYDVLGRVSETIYVVEGQPYRYASEFGYAGAPRVGSEPGSRLVTTHFPDGERLEYFSDASGNIQQTRSTLSDENQPSTAYSDVLLAATKVNEWGQVAWTDKGDGTRTHYIYDSVRRLSGTVTERKSDSFTLQSVGYTYDVLGRVTKLNDYCSWSGGTVSCCDMRLHSCAPAELSASYSYDVAGWLRSETQNGVTQAYAVDAIGNLISKAGETETYSDVTKPHAVTLLTSADGQLRGQYSYNAVGSLSQMVEDGNVTTFVWNGNNMPTRTERGSNVSERFYVGESLYKRRDVENGKESVTYFLPALRIENSVYRKNYGIAERESQPSTSDAVARRGTLRFYHVNHLGSSTLVTDASGTPVHRAVYAPYGGERKTEGNFSPKNTFGGKERESISGLYDFGARLYNPRIGRFVSVDSVMDGLNPYSYVRNDPINHVDPTGHQQEDARLTKKVVPDAFVSAEITEWKPHKPGWLARAWAYVKNVVKGAPASNVNADESFAQWDPKFSGARMASTPEGAKQLAQWLRPQMFVLSAGPGWVGYAAGIADAMMHDDNVGLAAVTGIFGLKGVTNRLLRIESPGRPLDPFDDFFELLPDNKRPAEIAAEVEKLYLNNSFYGTCTTATLHTSIKLSKESIYHELMVAEVIARDGKRGLHAFIRLEDGSVLSYGRLHTSIAELFGYYPLERFSPKKVTVLFYSENLGEFVKAVSQIQPFPPQPSLMTPAERILWGAK